MSLTIGSLFSGVAGIELGLELAIPGAHPIWLCEREPFPRAILEDRFPGVPIYRDVRLIDGKATRPDLICGGFPCQDVSVAGAGAGIAGGERSGLWWQFRRIVRELRPPLVFVENVFLGWRRWLPLVRRSLARIGYTALPLRVSAADVGAPHERARVFVLAYADGEQLRQLEQRLPGRRAGGVRDARQAEPRGDGANVADGRGIDGAQADQSGRPWRSDLDGHGDVADGNGPRPPALGLAQSSGLAGAAGSLAHGRYSAQWQFPPGPAGIQHVAWSSTRSSSRP